MSETVWEKSPVMTCAWLTLDEKILVLATAARMHKRFGHWLDRQVALLDALTEKHVNGILPSRPPLRTLWEAISGHVQLRPEHALDSRPRRDAHYGLPVAGICSNGHCDRVQLATVHRKNMRLVGQYVVERRSGKSTPRFYCSTCIKRAIARRKSGLSSGERIRYLPLCEAINKAERQNRPPRKHLRKGARRAKAVMRLVASRLR